MESINPLTVNFKPDVTTSRSFAEQMAKDAHGRHWEPPEARNFKDREPPRRSERLAPQTSHKLGDVVVDIVRGSILASIWFSSPQLDLFEWANRHEHLKYLES